MFSIQGKLIGKANPLLMGIVNLTDDSFYSGSRYPDLQAALQIASEMVAQGAEIIDVGAISTRPGARLIDANFERKKLMPVIREIRKHLPNSILSVDTYRSEIAKEVLDEGVDIINDISGGLFDPQMPVIIGRHNAPYVMMHIHRTPSDMQQFPIDEGVVEIVKDFFTRQLALFETFGANRILLDPGFGFGKTIRANYELLARFDELSVNGYPLLAGLSRKSMIYRTLIISPEEALNGTSALNLVALLKGASVLRVHDIRQACEIRKLHWQLSTSCHSQPK